MSGWTLVAAQKKRALTKNKTRQRGRVNSNFGILSTMSSNPFRQRPMTRSEVNAVSTAAGIVSAMKSKTRRAKGGFYSGA
jgi:hypothetical protein